MCVNGSGLLTASIRWRGEAVESAIASLRADAAGTVENGDSRCNGADSFGFAGFAGIASGLGCEFSCAPIAMDTLSGAAGDMDVICGCANRLVEIGVCAGAS